MTTARAWAAAVSPSRGPWAGLLAVSGGLTAGTGSHSTGSVEMYSPDTDSWTAGPPLLTPRHGHVSWVEPDGSIVVAGGRDSAGKYLASCEILSAQVPGSKWEPAGDLPEARFRAVAVTFCAK